MPVMTKRQKAAGSLYDAEKSYAVEDALGLVKKFPGAKFDETVDMSLRLGVDPKHADQMVRGAIVLPYMASEKPCASRSRQGREGHARRARRCGCGGRRGPRRGESRAVGWSSTRPSRPRISWVRSGGSARCWVRAGLMPNLKLGTVTFDVGRAVRGPRPGRWSSASTRLETFTCRLARSRLRLSNWRKRHGAVGSHRAGKAFGIERAVSAFDHPSSTMSPGVHVDVQRVANLFKM
jgi:hypothetical protein